MSVLSTCRIIRLSSLIFSVLTYITGFSQTNETPSAYVSPSFDNRVLQEPSPECSNCIPGGLNLYTNTLARTGIVVYPNPTTNGQVRIVFDPTVATTRDVIISNLSSGMVKQYNLSADNTLQVRDLPKGTYSVRAINRNSGAILMAKIIVN